MFHKSAWKTLWYLLYGCLSTSAMDTNSINRKKKYKIPWRLENTNLYWKKNCCKVFYFIVIQLVFLKKYNERFNFCFIEFFSFNAIKENKIRCKCGNFCMFKQSNLMTEWNYGFYKLFNWNFTKSYFFMHLQIDKEMCARKCWVTS